MSEQLSVAQLKSEVSIYDEFIEIPVSSQDKEYIVKMYPYFKPEKVRDLVNELAGFYKTCENENFTVPQNEEDDMVGYFIIKYFTNLKFTKSKKAKKIYEEFKIALNSSLFKTLMESYPQESIESVYDRIFDVIDNDKLIKNKLGQYQEMLQNLQLKNKEVFENVTKKQENNIVE